MQPAYYAVVPLPVRQSDRISANAKLFFGELSALTEPGGYVAADNGFFAEIYGLREEHVSRILAQLEEAGFIRREYDRDQMGRITGRKIYLNMSAYDGQPLDKNVNWPLIKTSSGVDKNVKWPLTETSSGVDENVKWAENPPAPPTSTEDLRRDNNIYINNNIIPPTIPPLGGACVFENSECPAETDNREADKPEPPEPPRPESPEEPEQLEKPKRKKSAPDCKPDRFERFWHFYRSVVPAGVPVGNRARAIAAWNKLRPSDALIRTMGNALVQQSRTDTWQRGIGIPHASTWLNGRRWEDVLPEPAAEQPRQEAVRIGWD